MKRILTKGKLSALIVTVVLIIDQAIKIWVKTNMYWHESIKITDWFYISFTENNGMAFGMEIFNKFFLTTFRIIAVIGITRLLIQCVKKKHNTGFLVSNEFDSKRANILLSNLERMGVTENIGFGEIGFDALSYIVHHPDFKDVPKKLLKEPLKHSLIKID